MDQQLLENIKINNIILALGFQVNELDSILNVAQEKGYVVKQIQSYEQIKETPHFLLLLNDEYIKTMKLNEQNKFRGLELNKINEEMVTVIIYCQHKSNQRYDHIVNHLIVQQQDMEDYQFCKKVIVQAKNDYQKRKKYKERKNNKLKYLIFSYKYLKARKELSVLELAQILKVSYRTAQRYLQEIEEATCAIQFDGQTNKWVYVSEEDEVVRFLDEMICERGSENISKFTRYTLNKELTDWDKDIINVYKNNAVNWRGVTADTSEYFTELVAKKLLREGLKDCLEDIQPIQRKASYHVNTTKANSKKMASLKNEDLLVAQLCDSSKNNSNHPYIGKVWDYLIPLKNKSTDKHLGTIDLISTFNNQLWLLEVKSWNSQETALKALLEVNIYSKLLDHQKMIEDFRDLWGNLQIEQVNRGIIVLEDSQAGEEFIEMIKGKRKYLELLVNELNTSIFVLAESNEKLSSSNIEIELKNPDLVKRNYRIIPLSQYNSL